MDDDDENDGGQGEEPGPAEGGPPQDVEALAELKARALEAARVVIACMRGAGRNCGTKLSAAKLVLESAGVGAHLADERHTELIRELRGKLSTGAYAEVLSALAESAGLDRDGAAKH